MILNAIVTAPSFSLFVFFQFDSWTISVLVSTQKTALNLYRHHHHRSRRTRSKPKKKKKKKNATNHPVAAAVAAAAAAATQNIRRREASPPCLQQKLCLSSQENNPLQKRNFRRCVSERSTSRQRRNPLLQAPKRKNPLRRNQARLPLLLLQELLLFQLKRSEPF